MITREQIMIGIIIALFLYIIYMTFFEPREKTENAGTLFVTKSEDEKFPAEIFLEMNIQPLELKNNETVSFTVKTIQPRN